MSVGAPHGPGTVLVAAVITTAFIRATMYLPVPVEPLPGVCIQPLDSL